MLYFKLDSNGDVTAVADKPETGLDRNHWIARHELVDLPYAERVAASATKLTGTLHIGIDQGANTWPRFDVVEAPKVGNPVSYAFNGDYYPDGHIIHVTEGTLRVIKTDTGSTYYRNKQSGSWRKEGGTWWLVDGHISKLNPSF